MNHYRVEIEHNDRILFLYVDGESAASVMDEMKEKYDRVIRVEEYPRS